MLYVQAWYETIFLGDLAIGFNRDKLHELNDETFLYLNEQMEEPPLEEVAL